jgi:ATP-dependent phosphofructokinase / diphosphate-dependent phosphofructokinase
MRSGKLVIAVGGGPTAVINQNLTGAVLEARRFPQIERVYGSRYGVRGIVDEDFVDLSAETRANLEAIAATPASALGSTRDKPDLDYCRDILASLRAHGACWFLYIGGNDTADTLRIVSEEAVKQGYDPRCIHIPKTIDNDLL